jgi:dihydroneopterin triphosphate diphosphatase
MPIPYKIPQSVLVVIYTPALDVLLIRRADVQGEEQGDEFWQSVTGSKDHDDEEFIQTAMREVAEETGLDCGPGTGLRAHLQDWHLENVYAIYPRWLHRYAPGVTHNVERIFGLRVPKGTPVQLNPREHSQFQWLPYLDAAAMCFAPSNAEAILQLPRFANDVSRTHNTATLKSGAPWR